MTNPMEREINAARAQFNDGVGFKGSDIERLIILAEAQAAQLAERDAELTAERAAVARLIHRAETAEALLQQAREGLIVIAKGNEAHRITSGWAGPMYSSGWAGAVEYLAEKAAATLAAIQPGDSHER